MIADPYTLLNAKAGTGVGNMAFIGDAEAVNIDVNTASSANLTVKFATSNQKDPPTVTSAQSSTNQWDYANVLDKEDGVSIDGDTGFVVAGSDDHRMFELNNSGARWLIPVITARTAGSVTVHATCINHNQ